MKKISTFFLIFVWSAVFIFPSPLYAATKITAVKNQKPLRANLFLSWKITEADARALSRWDLIVLDAEVGARQPKLIKKIRARNPNIKILAYVSAVELHKITNELEREAPVRAALLARAPEHMYTRRASGEAISFWPTAYLMNITGPWGDLLPDFIHKKILSNKLWDGIMLDNVWEGVTWYVGDVDLNRDFKIDPPDEANVAWKQATQKLISRIKKENPKKIILGNGSEKFTDLDGLVFENFQNQNLSDTISRAEEFRYTRAAQNKKSILIFNFTENNSATPNTERARSGLALAQEFDAYFSYDFGDKNHASLWWFKDSILPI